MIIAIYRVLIITITIKNPLTIKKISPIGPTIEQIIIKIIILMN